MGEEEEKMCNHYWRVDRDNQQVIIIDKEDPDKILSVIPIIEMIQMVDDWKATHTNQQFMEAHQAYHTGDFRAMAKAQAKLNRIEEVNNIVDRLEKYPGVKITKAKSYLESVSMDIGEMIVKIPKELVRDEE